MTNDNIIRASLQANQHKEAFINSTNMDIAKLIYAFRIGVSGISTEEGMREAAKSAKNAAPYLLEAFGVYKVTKNDETST
jgi:hypothetical protein